MEDPLHADIPAVHCPHCGEKFLRAEDLEVHRERHRLIAPRTEGSVNCSKGCKRWLVPGTAETQIHLALCDGLPPLNGFRSSMKKKWFCLEHGYGTDSGRGWGKHKQDYHGGADPLRPWKSALQVPMGPEVVDQAIALIKVERARHALEIERLDTAIKILERRKERDQS